MAIAGVSPHLNEWKQAQLSELGTLYCGQSPASGEVNTEGRGTPYVTGPEQWDGNILHRTKWTTDPRRLVPDGSIFITVKGAGVGKIFPGIHCAIGRDIYAFKPNDGVSPKFIEHALRLTVDQVLRHAVGDIPGLSKAHILDHHISLPGLVEQERIVAEIERQFSRLDEAVANLKRVKANLKRFRSSVLGAACVGRLSERGDSWPTSRSSALPSKAPGDFPPGWRLQRIDDLLSDERDGLRTGPFGTLLSKSDHRPSGVAVLGIENIQAMRFKRGSKIHIDSRKADQLESYSALSGDVLISRSGTVGEVCVVPDGLGEARISTNMLRVRLNHSIVDPRFFCILFNGSPFVLGQVRDLCKGSTRDFLNQGILRSVVFPVPPITEQRWVVAEVERRLSMADESEAQVEVGLRRAEGLRRAILKRAFEGNLG